MLKNIAMLLVVLLSVTSHAGYGVKELSPMSSSKENKINSVSHKSGKYTKEKTWDIVIFDNGENKFENDSASFGSFYGVPKLVREVSCEAGDELVTGGCYVGENLKLNGSVPSMEQNFWLCDVSGSASGRSKLSIVVVCKDMSTSITPVQ